MPAAIFLLNKNKRKYALKGEEKARLRLFVKQNRPCLLGKRGLNVPNDKVILKDDFICASCHTAYYRWQDTSTETEPQMRLSIQRSTSSHNQCVFGCASANYLVPKEVRDNVLLHHRHYVPVNARWCGQHLDEDWQKLPSTSHLSVFNQDQIVDMVDSLRALALTKEEFTNEILNFEYLEEIPEQLCLKWIGLSKDQFILLRQQLPGLTRHEVRAKLRTGDSDERLISLFNVPRFSGSRMMGRARVLARGLSSPSFRTFSIQSRSPKEPHNPCGKRAFWSSGCGQSDYHLGWYLCLRPEELQQCLPTEGIQWA